MLYPETEFLWPPGRHALKPIGSQATRLPSECYPPSRLSRELWSQAYGRGRDKRFWFTNGVGESRELREGCHVLPYMRACCRMLTNAAHISTSKADCLVGNRSTSATTPLVPAVLEVAEVGLRQPGRQLGEQSRV